MATYAQIEEARNEYPKTPEEAVWKYRKMLKMPDFQQAPSEKLKPGVISDDDDSLFWGFWYNKKMKKCFLFTNAPGHHNYKGHPYCVMKICVISGDTLYFLGTQNIIVDGHVHSSPTSQEWHNFRDVISDLANLGPAWESFYRSAF